MKRRTKKVKKFEDIQQLDDSYLDRVGGNIDVNEIIQNILDNMEEGVASDCLNQLANVIYEKAGKKRPKRHTRCTIDYIRLLAENLKNDEIRDGEEALRKVFEAGHNDMPKRHCCKTDPDLDAMFGANDEQIQSSLFVRKDKVFVKKGNDSHMVGLSRNIEDGFSIPIDSKFFTKDHVRESKEKAMSCVYPKTKSLSPSMAVHQIASIMLAMSVCNGTRAVSEDLIGNYRNDLTIIKGSTRVSIDICGSDTKRKMKKLTEDEERQNLRDIKLMVINKYKIVPCLNHELDYLIYTSLANDRKDAEYIHQKCSDFCDQYGRKFKVPLSVIKFFMHRKDPLGRSIEQHQTAAEHCLLEKTEFYKTENLYKSFSMSAGEEVSVRRMNYRTSLEDIIGAFGSKKKEFIERKVAKGRSRESVLESDYFIFPNIICDKESISEADIIGRLETLRDQKDDSQPELKDGVFQLSGHKDEVHRQASVKQKSPHYKPVRSIRTLSQPMIALRDYSARKTNSKLKTMNTYCAVVELLQKYGMAKTYSDILYVGNLIVREDYKVDEEGNLFIPLSNVDPTVKMEIGQQFEMVHEYDPRTSERNNHMCLLDPNHEIILAKKGCAITYKILLRSRSYQDLRFKSRIANAIINSPKPDRCFEIKHFKDGRKTAEVLIRGLLMKKDKGVAYITYLYDDKIYRCEKWRLPDVEFFTVNHTKLLTVLAGTELRYRKSGMRPESVQDLLDSMCRIFGAILLDNSWGLSNILKPYRYFVNGLIVKSPKVADSRKKLIEAVRDGNWKHTLHQMQFIMSSNFTKLIHTPYLTPLFMLPYEDMCNEIFIINACPSSIFGSKRHLQNCIKGVIEEIELFKENEQEVDELMLFFSEEVLFSNNLEEAYSTYIDMIEAVSYRTKGRFTNSPLSMVLISKEIDRVFSGKEANPSILQDSQPPLSRYCTAKASSNAEDKPMIAAESIAELQSELCTSSTSDMVLRILTMRDKINFSMRMFEKDQVGGDREISIMNSCMRVLVGSTEYFFRKVNMSMKNEYLHNKRKVKDFIINTKKSQNADISIMGSVDQTRWGPNHSTSIFGLMTLLYCKHNTEAYMASIPCFMGQCKIFEVGLWMDSYVKKVDTKAGNVIGKIGEWHMGQGIYHATSSSYHAVVTNFILSLMKREIESEYHWCVSIHTSSMVTSDDISFFVTCDSQDLFVNDYNNDLEILCDDGVTRKVSESKYEDFKKNLRKKMLVTVSYYESVLKYFGIKTSEYKNIYSSKYSEFNSMYSGPRGITKQDTKFACTLIRPETSGIMIHDYGNAISSYYNSIESGTSDEMAEMISLSNFHIFCTQWKINMSRTGVPSKNSMITGMIPLMKNPETGDRVDLKDYFIENKCFLRHQMRAFFEKAIDRIQSLNNGVQAALSIRNLRLISGSRKIEPYRACRTFYRGNKMTESVPVVHKVLGVMFITFELIVKNLNDDQNSIANMIDERCQLTYSSLLVEDSIQYKDPFEIYCVRQQESFGDDMFGAITGTREKISFVNNESSWDDFDYHMMRHSRSGDSCATICQMLPRDLSFSEKIDQISKMQDELYQPNGTSHQTLDPIIVRHLNLKKKSLGKTHESLSIKFQKSVKVPPKSHKAIKGSRIFTCLETKIDEETLKNIWKYKTGNTFLGEYRKRGDTIGNWKKSSGSFYFNLPTIECEIPPIDRGMLYLFAGKEIYDMNKNYMSTHKKSGVLEEGGEQRVDYWMTIQIPGGVKMPSIAPEAPVADNEVSESDDDFMTFMSKLPEYESVYSTTGAMIEELEEVPGDATSDGDDERMEIHEQIDRLNDQIMFSDDEVTEALRFSRTNEKKATTREIRVKVTSDISVVLNNYFKKVSIANMIMSQLRNANAIFGLSDQFAFDNIDWHSKNVPNFRFFTVDNALRQKVEKMVSDEIIEPVRYGVLSSEGYINYLRSLEADDAIYDGNKYKQTEYMCETNPIINFTDDKSAIEVDMDTFIEKYVETVNHWKEINKHLIL